MIRIFEITLTSSLMLSYSLSLSESESLRAPVPGSICFCLQSSSAVWLKFAQLLWFYRCPLLRH